eukprot:6354329-Amphidinium_carterae.1
MVSLDGDGGSILHLLVEAIELQLVLVGCGALCLLAFEIQSCNQTQCVLLDDDRSLKQSKQDKKPIVIRGGMKTVT